MRPNKLDPNVPAAPMVFVDAASFTDVDGKVDDLEMDAIGDRPDRLLPAGMV